MDDDMKYEMIIPMGVSGQIMAKLLEEFPDLEVKQTDEGPLLLGEKQKLENAQDYIIKALNERIKELEGDSYVD